MAQTFRFVGSGVIALILALCLTPTPSGAGIDARKLITLDAGCVSAERDMIPRKDDSTSLPAPASPAADLDHMKDVPVEQAVNSWRRGLRAHRSWWCWSPTPRRLKQETGLSHTSWS